MAVLPRTIPWPNRFFGRAGLRVSQRTARLCRLRAKYFLHSLADSSLSETFCKNGNSEGLKKASQCYPRAPVEEGPSQAAGDWDKMAHCWPEEWLPILCVWDQPRCPSLMYGMPWEVVWWSLWCQALSLCQCGTAATATVFMQLSYSSAAPYTDLHISEGVLF